MNILKKERIKKMAFIGLAYPVIAKLKEQTTELGVTTPVYEKAFVCGKAMAINITPNYNEANLFADNVLVEQTKEFKNGNITLGTNKMPVQAEETMFGHEVDEEEKEVTYKAGDLGSYVGVGFYVDEIDQGVKTYTASIVYKCLFTQGADDYVTKGESIEFKTPSLEGTIGALDDGQWKKTKTFTTQAAAIAWINSVLGLTA